MLFCMINCNISLLEGFVSPAATHSHYQRRKVKPKGTLNRPFGDSKIEQTKQLCWFLKLENFTLNTADSAQHRDPLHHFGSL